MIIDYQVSKPVANNEIEIIITDGVLTFQLRSSGVQEQPKLSRKSFYKGREELFMDWNFLIGSLVHKWMLIGARTFED